MNASNLSETEIIALMLIAGTPIPLHWHELEAAGISDIELFLLREKGMLDVIGDKLAKSGKCLITRHGRAALAEVLK